MVDTVNKIRNTINKKTEKSDVIMPTIIGFTQSVFIDEDLPEIIVQPSKAPTEEQITISGLPLGIVYVDSRGRKSNRRLTLRDVENKNGIIYLKAICHERNAFRSFRADRIEELVDGRTGEVFEEPKLFMDKLAQLAILPEGISNANPVASDQKKAVNRCRDGLRILMFISRCDGHYHRAERESIKKYCQKRCGKENTNGKPLDDYDMESLLAYADKMHPDKELFDNALGRILNKSSSGSHLKQLLENVLELIIADGKITPEEAVFTKELQEIIEEELSFLIM